MQPWRFLEIKFVIGTICLGAIVLLALLGGLVAGHDPNEQNLMFALEPPFGIESGYYLGTDHLGRDLLARMTSGARISLAIAGSVVVLSGVVGVLIGALSGYLAGARDAVIQKVVETFWAFPPILLAIAILAFFLVRARREHLDQIGRPKAPKPKKTRIWDEEDD